MPGRLPIGIGLVALVLWGELLNGFNRLKIRKNDWEKKAFLLDLDFASNVGNFIIRLTYFLGV